MGEAGVIDEGFFRRYRELLDAEDAAFDELEHAYEEGDRAHYEQDLDGLAIGGRAPQRLSRPPRHRRGQRVTQLR